MPDALQAQQLLDQAKARLLQRTGPARMTPSVSLVPRNGLRIVGRLLGNAEYRQTTDGRPWVHLIVDHRKDQFMVANATGATAVIEDETFGGEVRVTLEDAFLSAAGETCKRATLLSAQHEAEIVVICHNGQEGDGSNPGEWRLMPRVWGKGISTP